MNTTPNPVHARPSGGLVLPSAGMLPGLPRQPKPATTPRLPEDVTAPTGRPHPLVDVVSAASQPYTTAQLLGEECALCGNDLAYADGQRPHPTKDGKQLNACAPPCHRPTTASQRGPEWTARYGCPGDWCDMQHDSTDGTPGWHQGRTVKVTAPTSTFGVPDSSEPESTVLAARITQVTEDHEAFGLKTTVWLDVGTEILELNVPQARALFAAMRRMLPALEAMCDQAERLAEDDHPGDPEIKARVMARVDAHIKAITDGRPCGCPRCAEETGR